MSQILNVWLNGTNDFICPGNILCVLEEKYILVFKLFTVDTFLVKVQQWLTSNNTDNCYRISKNRSSFSPSVTLAKEIKTDAKKQL